MFLDLDKKEAGRPAVQDDSGSILTYGEIVAFSGVFKKQIPARSLVFLLAENKIGSLLGYTASLSDGIVPLVISAKTETGLYLHLLETYHPAFLWVPDSLSDSLGFKQVFSAYGYSLLVTGFGPVSLHPDLALLLPTSGSTGSPKLVRHSLRNIEANADNVRRMFQLNGAEVAMAVLPMHYTMGLSVIASHLLAGARLLLTDRSMLDGGFWAMMKEATSFTGVPYSYELLMKMRFMRMDLPKLKVITQGGGKLTPELFHSLAQYAENTGRQFIATYGQSECTARMAYLPPELAMEKTCSIGIAEPGGCLSIIDSDGNESFEGEASGEMVYRGENVTLGYAYTREDLLKGDENHGVMHTGDLARRDADGCYYIMGRMKRFLKIYGLRIGLDEVEQLVKSAFDTDCVCGGSDEELRVYVTNGSIVDQVAQFIEEKTHLFHKTINVKFVDAIERNEAGKVLLKDL